MNLSDLKWHKGVWVTPDGKSVPYDEANVTEAFDPVIRPDRQIVITVRRWPRKVVFEWQETNLYYDIGGAELYHQDFINSDYHDDIEQEPEWRGGKLYTTDRVSLTLDPDAEFGKAKVAFEEQYSKARWASQRFEDAFDRQIGMADDLPNGS